VLAAGEGSRFAGPTHKLLALIDGRPVVAWALDHAAAAGLDELIVVTGAAEIDHLAPAGATVVHNAGWSEGQATSLAAAIDVAGSHGHSAVVAGLGDQPLVPAAAWRAVADSTAPIAVATYDGRRGNPVRLGAEVWPLLPSAGDAGGRVAMAMRPDLVEEVACDGDPFDIDTQEDLSRWS
jgi:CTP:molybdopterin cytidylyltransferase MocA